MALFCGIQGDPLGQLPLQGSMCQNLVVDPQEQTLLQGSMWVVVDPQEQAPKQDSRFRTIDLWVQLKLKVPRLAVAPGAPKAQQQIKAILLL